MINVGFMTAIVCIFVVMKITVNIVQSCFLTLVHLCESIIISIENYNYKI